MGRKDGHLSFLIQNFYGHKLILVQSLLCSLLRMINEKKTQNNSSWKEYREELNQKFSNKCLAQKQVSDGFCSNLLSNKDVLLSRTL